MKKVLHRKSGKQIINNLTLPCFEEDGNVFFAKINEILVVIEF